MGVYVYILQLDGRKFYTGITKDIYKRLSQHLSKQCISTRYHSSLVVRHFKRYESYNIARKIEVRIKNMGAKKYLSKLKFENGISECELWNLDC